MIDLPISFLVNSKTNRGQLAVARSTAYERLTRPMAYDFAICELPT